MKRTLPFSCTIAALTGLFVWLGVSSGPVLPKAGKEVRIYGTSDDLERTYLTAIKSATNSIHLSIYTLTDTPIINALKSASEGDVEVVVLFDEKQARGLEGHLGPNVDTIPRRPSGLMHQKILVVDAKQVFIGSANMSKQSLRIDQNLVVAFEDPVVAQTLIENITTRRTRGPPPPTQNRFLVAGQPLFLYLLPTDKHQALDHLKTLLQTAHKTVRIAMFAFTHQDLITALIDLHERDVRVDVTIDKGSAKGTSKKAYQTLTNALVPCRASSCPGVLHTKIAWIDQETLVCGSTNWSKSGFGRNEECMLILGELTVTQQKRLKKLWPK